MKTKLVDSYSANSLAPPNIRRNNSSSSRSKSNRCDNCDGPNDNLTNDEVFVDLRTGRKESRRPTISGIDLFEKQKSSTSQGGFVGYIQDWSQRTFKKKILHKKVPILNWIQRYNLKTFVADLISGFTIGVAILPQGLAYATIAGLPPQYGLYSGLVGPFIYILFGTSKFVTIGPTAGMAMITLSYMDEKPVELAILLSFLTGILTLLLGLLHLGFVLNFISVPVISAFSSAMAVAIFSTQLPALLGINYKAEGFIDMLVATVEHIKYFKTYDTVLGLICILILLIIQHLQTIARKIFKKIPLRIDNLLWFIATARNAIVVVVCTSVFGYLGDPPPVEIVGHIEAGLPKFTIPTFWFTINDTLTGETHEYSIQYYLTENRSALLLVPLIAITEHITIAKDWESDGTDRVNTSQEMTCIGFSNLIGSFLGSMPVTGSFIRPNSVNQSSRDQSPMGGCITGILVILTLLFLTPYFYHIPKATLAAVIVAGVVVEIDIGIIRGIWRSKKTDLIPWTITFVIGLSLSLEYGILLGLGISILYILYYAALPQIRVNMGETGTGILFVIVEMDRSLIFPSVEYSQYALLKSGSQWGHDQLPVVIDCQHIQFADYTAAYGIRNLFNKFNAKSQKLILWKLKPSVLRIVTGVMKNDGVPFEHCSTEIELENWLEGESAEIKREE